jgi:hypothetical protein
MGSRDDGMLSTVAHSKGPATTEFPSSCLKQVQPSPANMTALACLGDQALPKHCITHISFVDPFNQTQWLVPHHHSAR